MTHFRRTAWRIVCISCIVYLAVLAMFATLQRSLIYHPTRAGSMPPTSAGWSPTAAHSISLDRGDGLVLHGWHILASRDATRDEAAARASLGHATWVVLYFSGNAGHRGYRVAECRLFAECDCHVLLFDYRGFAENEGTPSEEALADDALAVWRFAVETCHVPPERVILAGESLGGGVAVRLAEALCQSDTPPGGLILRSTFSSLVDTAAGHFPWLPVRWVLVDRYPSIDRIGAVTCPILQVHGERDMIVPAPLGQRLFNAAPASSTDGVAKRWVTLSHADHNDVLDIAYRPFQDAVREFLALLRQPSAVGWDKRLERIPPPDDIP